MENSKLIDLLRSFTTREWRTFREMVAAPYFNRNQDLLRLTDWLDTYAPEFKTLSRASAITHLFPGDLQADARLNHLMSFLLKLAEDFVGMEAFRKEKYQAEYYVLRGLVDRGLEKHYRYNLEKVRRVFDTDPAPGEYFHKRFAVEILEAERIARSSPRQFNESVQQATDSLDAFYLLEKLRRTCYMFTSQAILATPYNIQLVEEICRFVGANLHQLASPAIEAYYRVFQLLTKDNPHEDFQALKVLLASRAAEFGKTDLTDVYQYAINFCNIQINKAQEAYVTEAFDLYTNGLESGILMEGEYLSPWQFKNIIHLSLKLKKYAWTEGFIHAYTPLLAQEFQADALHYNLAQLYYNTERHADAMVHLNRVEFTDVHYSLGAKFMLCQMYYQNDDYDALESLLQAFNNFLRRNKLIAESTRQAYLNFIQVLRKILRQPAGQFTAVIQDMEKMRILAGKDWLLQILRRGQ